jgi:hypothetical protein
MVVLPPSLTDDHTPTTNDQRRTTNDVSPRLTTITRRALIIRE